MQIQDMIEQDKPFSSIDDILDRYEIEPELKEWSGILITKNSDTNMHPFVAQTISDMLLSGRFKNVVEIATHHGVLAKMWAQNNMEVHFAVVGVDNEQLHANLDGMPNVTILPNADTVVNADFVIINYGLSDPDYNDMARVTNILYQYGGRLVILGYQKILEEIVEWYTTNCHKLKKIYEKMDCIIFEVNGD
jgi:hypothetical protein